MDKMYETIKSHKNVEIYDLADAIDIDLDKEYLRIIDHGDILAYRYKELMDAKR